MAFNGIIFVLALCEIKRCRLPLCRAQGEDYKDVQLV